ncbi:uncharacterized protein [Nicotiana tomentosiformis]|uniref:uncharacterized protein n=1 Tax=Nicotiana tomentosiformis TaxID=4098 RepID=UPI00388C3582
MGSLAFLPVVERPLAMDVQALANRFVRLDVLEPSQVLVCVVAKSSLLERIKARQFDDPHLLVLKDTVQRGGAKEVVIGDDGAIRLSGRICFSNVDGLREFILEEAHSSRYSIHPGVTKMYRDLKQYYWRRKMKKDIVGHVSRCLNCQQMKYEYQKLGRLTQRLVIPKWKWERIMMDFVVGLPRTLRKYDVVWVIMERLTKSAHFILVMTSYSSE